MIERRQSRLRGQDAATHPHAGSAPGGALVRREPDAVVASRVRHLTDRRAMTWLSWTAAAVVLGVAVVGAVALSRLQAQAAHRDELQTVVAELTTLTWQQGALVSHVMHTEEVNDGKAGQTRETQERAGELAARWVALDPEHPEALAVQTDLATYFDAVNEQLDLVRAGPPMDVAEAFHDVTVDPAFEVVLEELDGAAQTYLPETAGDRAVAAPTWILLAGGALACGLIWLLHLAQNRTVRRVREASRYDVLTGLPNRELLRDRFTASVQAADGSFEQAALLLIDLDGFKAVNDTYGHHRGDQLLVKAAQRMTAATRAEDTVARLGGDEFAVLLQGMSVDNVAAVASSLRATLSAPFTLDGVTVAVGASIGAAVYPLHGRDLDELLRHADAAMYAAKKARSGFRLFAAAALESADGDVLDAAGTVQRVSLRALPALPDGEADDPGLTRPAV